MTDINNKPTKSRLKGYDRILAAALSLPLAEQVSLVKAVTAEIESAVRLAKTHAEDVENLAKDL